MAPPTRATALITTTVLGGLFLAVYGPLLPGLAHDWSSHPILSHGFAIPLIAGFLLWSRRRAFRSLPVHPSRAGLIVLAAALAIAVVGVAGGEPFATRLSLVPALFGLIWAVLGWPVARLALFPIAYLFFMIPPPFVLVKRAMTETRLFDAWISAEALQLVGIPLHREGNMLHLPNMTLEVADPCSSVLAMVALSALAAAYAYVSQTSLLGRVLLVAAAFPLAVLSNVIRIVVLATGVYNFGPIMMAYITEQTYGIINFVVFTMLLVVVDRLIAAFSEPARAEQPDAA
jgi:exosortase